MKEHPIIFSTKMVEAILDDRKTQTRRLNKLEHVNIFPDMWKVYCYTNENGFWAWFSTKVNFPYEQRVIRCPFGQVSDRLWVKETHYRFGHWNKNGFTKTGKQKWTFKPSNKEIRYFDNPPENIKSNSYRKEGWYKRPSIFMFRWASRITLEITGIRIEKLQDIELVDIIDEGTLIPEEIYNLPDHKGKYLAIQQYFIDLWDSINSKKYPWSSNPWVFVIEFKRIKP